MSQFQAKNAAGIFANVTPAQAKVFASMGFETREIADAPKIPMSTFDEHSEATYRVSVKDLTTGVIRVAYLSISETSKNVDSILSDGFTPAEIVSDPTTRAIREYAVESGLTDSARGKLSHAAHAAWNGLDTSDRAARVARASQA